MADTKTSALPAASTPLADADLAYVVQSGNSRQTTVGDLVGSLTGSELHVDATHGDDATAISGRADRPWLTVGAALTAAVSGDAVLVRPGAYAETGLTVPGGVALIGVGGMRVTTIGDSAVAAHAVTLSDGSLIQGFALLVPTGAAFAALIHSAGTGTVYDLDFQGDVGAGAGSGLYKTGTGKIVGGNIRCSAGGIGNVLRVDAGVLALDDVHVPQSAGTIANVLLCEGSGRFQGQGFNAGNTNIGDVVEVGGTSTCIVYSPNWFNVPVAAHITADGVTVTVVGGRIDPTAASILVDPALTGSGTTVTVASSTVQPLFSFPSPAITAMDLNASFHQEPTTTRDAEYRQVGAALVTGFPELGSGLSVGEGSAYSDGQIVLTTDGTAGPASDGAGFVDVSTEAASRDSSTFAFQALTAGHSILWTTDRTDAASASLRHWGVELDQVAAAVLGGGSFIWEVQTAAGTWTEIGVMAVSAAAGHRYASDVFLRSSSDEIIRAGIDSVTTWPATTINGVLGRWMRVRIDSTITTGPTFERMRLLPSSTATNALGQLSARGLAQWRSELFGVGNSWGEIGGAADANIAVGSGGAPTGWTSKIKKGLLNSAGDAASFQFQIPDGINTAFPLTFSLTYSLAGASPITVAPDVILSVLVLGAGGVSIADAAGGAVPVARAAATAAEVFTSKPATAITVQTDTGAVTDRPLTMEFGPYPIADYYQGDSVILALELDADGTPAQNLTIWSLVISGVRMAPGGTL